MSLIPTSNPILILHCDIITRLCCKGNSDLANESTKWQAEIEIKAVTRENHLQNPWNVFENPIMTKQQQIDIKWAQLIPQPFGSR